MHKMLKKRIIGLLSVLCLVFSLSACTKPSVKTDSTGTRSFVTETEEPARPNKHNLSEDTRCDDKACVALYLETYEHLPANYMTKDEARKKGWEGGALCQTIPGMAIGGDHYGNYEGTLPKKKGRKYWECDIDTIGKKSRGEKRIIYTNDGLIYYTDDHYETFDLLHGEE